MVIFANVTCYPNRFIFYYLFFIFTLNPFVILPKSVCYPYLRQGLCLCWDWHYCHVRRHCRCSC